MFKNNKWLKWIGNRYFLIGMIFIVWMLFFDTNSYLIHRDLNKEIEGLESNINFYKKEIEHDKKFIKKLDDPDEMERYAREQYYLKKENEEIFIIEHEDSIKKKK